MADRLRLLCPQLSLYWLKFLRNLSTNPTSIDCQTTMIIIVTSFAVLIGISAVSAILHDLIVWIFKFFFNCSLISTRTHTLVENSHNHAHHLNWKSMHVHFCHSFDCIGHNGKYSAAAYCVCVGSFFVEFSLSYSYGPMCPFPLSPAHVSHPSNRIS